MYTLVTTLSISGLDIVNRWRLVRLILVMDSRGHCTAPAVELARCQLTWTISGSGKMVVSCRRRRRREMLLCRDCCSSYFRWQLLVVKNVAQTHEAGAEASKSVLEVHSLTWRGGIWNRKWHAIKSYCLGSSVTRVGDLLDFGQVFKVFGNNNFAKNLVHS